MTADDLREAARRLVERAPKIEDATARKVAAMFGTGAKSARKGRKVAA